MSNEVAPNNLVFIIIKAGPEHTECLKMQVFLSQAFDPRAKQHLRISDMHAQISDANHIIPLFC